MSRKQLEDLLKTRVSQPRPKKLAPSPEKILPLPKSLSRLHPLSNINKVEESEMKN